MEWIRNYMETYEIIQFLGYDSWRIVKGVYFETDLLLNLKLMVVPLFFFIAVHQIVHRYGSNVIFTLRVSTDIILSVALVCSMFLLIGMQELVNLVNQPYDFSSFYYRFINIYILVLLFSAYIVIIEVKKEKPVAPPKVVRSYGLMALLFCLPLTAFVGSDTPLSDMIYEHIYPWFILIAILLDYISRRLRFYFMTSVLLVVISGLVQFMHYRVNPYYLPENIFKQKYTVKGLENIKLDEPTWRFLEDVYKAIKEYGYEKGGQVIALTNMPGVVYLLGAKSPGTGFYYTPPVSDSLGNYNKYNCYFLSKLSLVKDDALPFILLSEQVNEELITCLENTEIGFPENYKKIGSTRHSLDNVNVGIYAPLPKQ